jgi:LytS/YehU family sensor histidine kinase
MTTGLWLGCMSIVSWLWKKYPWEQSPWKHLILETVLILIYTVVFSGTIYLIEVRLLDFIKSDNIGLEILATILITLLITSIHESIFFYRQWKYNFSKSVRLERDNIEARYEALRAQINPHFLFNSLNSLITIAGNNTEVVNYTQDLSELLRYSPRSGEKELVFLQEEVEILKRYANLQQKRFHPNLSIMIEAPGNCLRMVIPPLVLQMLVENCIKHNVISSEKPLLIEVIADNESVMVTNNLQRKQSEESTGTGLNNIRGRYKFLTTREVVVADDSKSFRVTLPLLQLEL